MFIIERILGILLGNHFLGLKTYNCRALRLTWFPLTACNAVTYNMPDLHSLSAGSWPAKAVRNNGSDHLALERYKLRELAEGWPCYR